MLTLERSHQACGGVPGVGSTDDAAGSSSEGQQDSGTTLADQVAVAGDGALVNIGKVRQRAKKVAGSQSGFPKKSFSPLMSTGVQFLAQRC